MSDKNKKTKSSTTMLHLRVDRSLRDDVKKLANSMGVSVSLVGEVLFKQFLEEKRLILKASYEPNKKLKTILDEAEKNRDNANYWQSADSVDNLMNSLRK